MNASKILRTALSRLKSPSHPERSWLMTVIAFLFISMAVAAYAVGPQDSLALVDSIETTAPEDPAHNAQLPLSQNEQGLSRIMGEPNGRNNGGCQSVGLVLSGGGAKGIAHVGVIKALEDNDIPIDYVVGTSMGAVVGSVYSCGWSPKEMLDFFTSADFNYWATGEIDPTNLYYFSEQAPTPRWVGFDLSFKKSNNIAGQIIPASLINPLPMNIEFLKLFTKYSVQCGEDFHNLFVPFQCVCSDIYHKHKVVLRNGSLGDAVRASMSFPLVYRPIEINGLLMFDGGIYDNFPVNVMHEDFNPDFIIGVSVSGPDGKPEPGNPYSQLEDMIIQNNDYSVPEDEGIKIQVPVLDFGVLDWSSAREIYDIGYQTGLSMVDSIKKRVSARRPLEIVNARRREFASQTPRVEFDSVQVTGATRGQSRYLRYLFDRGLDRPFGMKQTEDGYYRAIAEGKLNNLLPQSRLNLAADSLQERVDRNENPTTRPVVSANTLLLEAQVKNPWSIGIGGWITSSTNTFLYLDLGYHTLSFNSLDVDASFWVGQSYYAAMGSAKFALNTAIPSCLQLEGVLSRQKYYDSELLFYENSSPSFITDTQHFLRLNYSMALGRDSKAMVSAGYGHLYDQYYSMIERRFDGEEKLESHYHILAARLEAEKYTLNNPLYPSSGLQLKGALVVSHEDSRTYSKGMAKDERPGFESHLRGRLKGEWKQFFPLSKQFTIGGNATAVGTLSRLYGNYTATMIHAEAFEPTPSTKNYFNPAFRSNDFVSAGVLPIWQPLDHFQLRGDFHLFLPIRNIGSNAMGMAVHDGWFRNPQFIGEIAAVYNFKFSSLSLYGNYLSSPARNWNFGINFGLYFQAPHFVR